MFKLNYHNDCGSSHNGVFLEVSFKHMHKNLTLYCKLTFTKPSLIQLCWKFGLNVPAVRRGDGGWALLGLSAAKA